ncbi:hypothetical protein RJ639_031552, partial [Escallonia herrerae]
LRMAMRSVIPRALTGEVQGIPRSAVSALVRRLSDGRVLSEEERAAENVYIKAFIRIFMYIYTYIWCIFIINHFLLLYVCTQKMEKERQEKQNLQAEKEKAEKDKADKVSNLTWVSSFLLTGRSTRLIRRSIGDFGISLELALADRTLD